MINLEELSVAAFSYNQESGNIYFNKKFNLLSANIKKKINKINFNDKFPFQNIENDIKIIEISTDTYILEEIQDSFEIIKESTKHTIALQMRILNELGEGVLIIDKNKKIIFCNPSAELSFGLISYKIIGNEFLNFIYPEEEKIRVKNIIKRTKTIKSNSIKFETQIQRKNKEIIHILVYYSLMKSKGLLEGALLTMYDISDIKNLTKKIQERSNELIQAEKMASIGLLASGVAHELNNPLSYIISNTESLEDYINTILKYLNKWESIKDLNLNNEFFSNKILFINDFFESENVQNIKEDIFKIIESNKRGLLRLSDVISDLRTFSHSHADLNENLKKMNINQPINLSLNLLSYELKNIEVQLSTQESLYISGTPKLYQVFLNIIHNGIQAMNDSKNTGLIRITTTKENDKIKVLLSDNGNGISEESLSRIFDPFYTTKEPGVGTGLGLSIAQRIINDHGGYIIAESSKILSGATFTIYFPLYNNKES